MKPSRLMSGVGVAALMASAWTGIAHAAHPPGSIPLTACGTTLTWSGYYYLAANLTCLGDGVVIRGNNITLDLHGRSIVADGAGNGTGVSASAPKGPDSLVGDAGVRIEGRTGITVTDSASDGACAPELFANAVVGFDAGLYVLTSANVTISNLCIRDNIGTMISDYGEGVAILDSSYVIVQNNEIRHNGPFAGVGLYEWYSTGDTYNNTIRNNTIADNDINSGPVGLTGFSSQADGVRIEPGVEYTTVENNLVERNGLDGIAMISGFPFGLPTTGHVIRNNTVRYNGFHEYVGPAADNGLGWCPLPLQSCPQDPENHFRNGDQPPNSNTPTSVSPNAGPNGYAQFSHRFGDGIRVSESSTVGGATIGTPGVGGTGSGNLVCGNAANGIRVDGSGNTIQNNTSGAGTGCAPNDVEDVPAPNAAYDLHGSCLGNTWSSNSYGTKNPSCIS